jgi:hypothetical protein
VRLWDVPYSFGVFIFQVDGLSSTFSWPRLSVVLCVDFAGEPKALPLTNCWSQEATVFRRLRETYFFFSLWEAKSFPKNSVIQCDSLGSILLYTLNKFSACDPFLILFITLPLFPKTSLLLGPHTRPSPPSLQLFWVKQKECSLKVIAFAFLRILPSVNIC